MQTITFARGIAAGMTAAQIDAHNSQARDAQRIAEAAKVAPVYGTPWINPRTGEVRNYINNVADIIGERRTDVRAYLVAGVLHIVGAGRQATEDMIRAAVAA